MATQTLAKPLRSQLENTVKAARDIAETAAQAAINQLGVGEAKAPEHLNDEQKHLRRRLRAHGRQLGDSKHVNDTQEIRRLVWETAYEHWHRMLFARFLAENHLLMWEPGAPVTLAECAELANDPDVNMRAKSGWDLAGKLAARMLPQVFKSQSPVFALSFAPEHQRELEKLLNNLPSEVFQASDSLGWVYQFWQAKRKDEVNNSEVKIGADELPAVTQLFTEPYMVEFLLHNSLGAWWVTRHPDKPCPVELTYLRTVPSPSHQGGEGETTPAADQPRHSGMDAGIQRPGTASEPLMPELGEIPAAGKFEGWPDSLAEFTLLDPCCGSGHFLVAAFLMLVPMRMVAEGLSAKEAVDAVLRDNLHGLELDARCVELAVFALALAAWKYPNLPSPSDGRGVGGEGVPLGYRELPKLNIACCGLAVTGKEADWLALAGDDEHLQRGMKALYDAFQDAPLLGSLIDPQRAASGDLITADFAELAPLLSEALAKETPSAETEEGEELSETVIAAQGLAEAARLLAKKYHLVITNVPYLTRGKQSEKLKKFCETHYSNAKNDLANVFLERCLQLSRKQGVVQIVMPQNWLFLTSYKKQREHLLKYESWNLLVRLGEGGFDSSQAAGAFTILLTLTRQKPSNDFLLRGIHASEPKNAREKVESILSENLIEIVQREQLNNPDLVVALANIRSKEMLSDYAIGLAGVLNGDTTRFEACFWEITQIGEIWEFEQSTVDKTLEYGGRHKVILWEGGNGKLRAFANEAKERLHDADRRGNASWGKKAVGISQMRNLPATLGTGNKFDTNIAIILPKKEEFLLPIWVYCSADQYKEDVRKISQKLNVTNASLVKVPFDLEYWQQIAAERYPNGLPKPYSDDPTQWIFHGHPKPSIDPLQVALARLLGYNWPAETDETMELSDEARDWIAQCAKLTHHADDDGIICLPPLRGEKSAAERLLNLLIDAWETVEPGSWKASILDKLLAEADCAGKTLEVWLRDKCFEQHCKRFHHRPFIWHVWDGQKDGFAALVNYHKLDAKNLERLIHTYLGDWIRIQEQGVKDNIDGAVTRLAAAKNLQQRLELILEGETPHDIFIRWKPIEQQPIGWNPDLNDGVRLNIRPFMTAEVLRHNKPPKLNIKWDKDRGKDVSSAPWYPVFNGDRINDHHLSLAEKREANKGK